MQWTGKVKRDIKDRWRQYKMAYKLSPSSLHLMKDCPRCFWLTLHKKWSRPQSGFPSLPSGMDSILKKHFDKFRDRGELPPELCENEECRDMKLFDDAEILKNWRNNLKGVLWTDDDGNILHGAVDNILVHKGKLVVLDYKTKGFPLKENSHEAYEDQLEIYSFLLKMNGYETEAFAFLLFYVPREVTETGEVIFDTTLKKVKVDGSRAGKMFSDALEFLNGDCPEKGCAWCCGVENE